MLALENLIEVKPVNLDELKNSFITAYTFFGVALPTEFWDLHSRLIKENDSQTFDYSAIINELNNGVTTLLNKRDHLIRLKTVDYELYLSQKKSTSLELLFEKNEAFFQSYITRMESPSLNPRPN